MFGTDTAEIGAWMAGGAQRRHGVMPAYAQQGLTSASRSGRRIAEFVARPFRRANSPAQ